ncbi:hypothetical protein LPTSP4_15750 [Leptospira ryugenii]|uniref:Uncharacterized protein n=1 Tax=Leptospira ryugenii TaxID=1917863 RepID=A0A2P2DZJ7_9LEPT|nr:hypothetical protein [Leptospira ryugenii]GBF50054.1 hypothetical protein LPTSP4_15750 [Leptospira ryugenii]
MNPERERISIADLDIINEIVQKDAKLFLQLYPPIESVEEILKESPFKWRFLYSETVFESLLSEMGSFTVRLAEHHRFKKNPPVLFYVSIGKYSGTFVWENEDQKRMEMSLATLRDAVQEKLDLYLETKE